MARTGSTTPDVIAQAVVAQLTGGGSASQFNSATCYLVIDATSPPQSNPGELFAQVGFDLDASWDQPRIDGGGNATLSVVTSLLVAIYSTIPLVDLSGQATAQLTLSAKGLYIASTNCLKDLSLFDPTSGSDQILCEPMRPTGLQYEALTGTLSRALHRFEVQFDWKLT